MLWLSLTHKRRVFVGTPTNHGEMAASKDDQITYWSVSVSICAVALVLLLRLGYLLFRFRHSVTRQVWMFSVMLLGDIIHITNFSVNHMGNITRTLVKGYRPWVELSDGSPQCLIVSYITIIASTLMMMGVTFTAIQPLRVLSATRRLKFLRLNGPREAALLATFSVLVGTGIAALNHSTGVLGNHLGLYCTFNNLNTLQSGGLTILTTMINVMIIIFVLYDLRRKVDQTEEFKKWHGYDELTKRIKRVMLSFIIFWFPVCAVSMMSFSDRTPPIIWEMMAGWCVKAKPIYDVWILAQFEVVDGLKMQSVFFRSSKAAIPHAESRHERREASTAKFEVVTIFPLHQAPTERTPSSELIPFRLPPLDKSTRTINEHQPGWQ